MRFFKKRENKSKEMSELDRIFQHNPADGPYIELVIEDLFLDRPGVEITKRCSRIKRFWNAFKASVKRPKWFKSKNEEQPMVDDRTYGAVSDWLNKEFSVFISPSPSLENLFPPSAYMFRDPPTIHYDEISDTVSEWEPDFYGNPL